MANPLEDTSEAEPSTVNNHKVLSKSNAVTLRQDLIDYPLSLHGSGRCCVGRITLATGFSIQLIAKIVDNALFLPSVERVRILLFLVLPMPKQFVTGYKNTIDVY